MIFKEKKEELYRTDKSFLKQASVIPKNFKRINYHEEIEVAFSISYFFIEFEPNDIFGVSKLANSFS